MLCWICILITTPWLQTHFSLWCLWQLCHFTKWGIEPPNPHLDLFLSETQVSHWHPCSPLLQHCWTLKMWGKQRKLGEKNPIRFTTAYPILPRKRNYSWCPQPKSPALAKTLWGVSDMCLPAWYLDLGDRISGLPCGTLGNLLNSFES